MAQNFAFLMYSPSAVATIGGAAGITTVSLGTSATGLPATAVRLWNNGTAAAFVLMGTGTTLTSTGGIPNGMPVPASVSPFVLRTGGQTTIQLGAASTFTTTIFATAGEGID